MKHTKSTLRTGLITA